MTVSNIPTQFNSIPLLTGSNYSKWKSSVEIVLGCMDLDLALEEVEPPTPTDSSTDSAKAHYKAWTKSNKMCLKIIKNSISETMQGVMPDTEKAKDFLTEIGK